jgi:G3E family GTPase
LHPVESRVDEVAAAAVAHAQAITVRHQRIEARTAERREAEQQVQQHDQQSRRISFFKERADMLDEVARLDRFLQHIRETNDYPSVKMHEFLKWAQAYISGLRQRCNAAAIDDELTESELW